MYSHSVFISKKQIKEFSLYFLLNFWQPEEDFTFRYWNMYNRAKKGRENQNINKNIIKSKYLKLTGGNE